MVPPHLPTEPISIGRSGGFLIVACSILWLISFPPFHLMVPPFIALVPFVWLMAREHRPSHAARTGFLTGLAANALVMHWLPITLWRHTPWALAFSLLLVVLASVGWGLVGWAVVRIWQRWPGMPRWLAFAGCWTTFEVLLDHLGPWSFPWLGLGVSLSGTPALLQIADLAGTPGMAFWLAAMNGVLAAVATGRVRAGVAAAVVIGSVATVWGYGYVRQGSLDMRHLGSVALVQPNAGVEEKGADDLDRLFSRTVLQTNNDVAADSVDLIVWPETSLPEPVDRHAEWGAALAAMASSLRTPLLVGALTENAAGVHGNGALFVAPGHGAHTVYVKRRLVPVTERWLEPGTDAVLIETPLGLAGLTICYESIFPGPFRRYRADGSDLAIVITNDAWFGRTGGAAQHAAHAVVRAVETRQSIIRAANSGYSFVASPTGRVARRTRLFETTTLIAPVWGGVAPPIFVRWGWLLGYVVLVATLALLGSTFRPPVRGQAVAGS